MSNINRGWVDGGKHIFGWCYVMFLSLIILELKLFKATKIKQVKAQ
jgi:hypothetical protein